jgi:energy-converting hydrogenase A subunit M
MISKERDAIVETSGSRSDLSRRVMASLTGHVSHYTEEVAAERAVRRVKGVHAIAEEFEVRCLGETSDEEIARRAFNILNDAP